MTCIWFTLSCSLSGFQSEQIRPSGGSVVARASKSFVGIPPPPPPPPCWERAHVMGRLLLGLSSEEHLPVIIPWLIGQCVASLSYGNRLRGDGASNEQYRRKLFRLRRKCRVRFCPRVAADCKLDGGAPTDGSDPWTCGNVSCWSNRSWQPVGRFVITGIALFAANLSLVGCAVLPPPPFTLWQVFIGWEIRLREKYCNSCAKSCSILHDVW